MHWRGAQRSETTGVSVTKIWLTLLACLGTALVLAAVLA